MPLDLAKFVATRPRLFHLTDRSNVALILSSGRLETAAVLLKKANRRSVIRERREHSLNIRVGEHNVHVRDQAPLHDGNLALSSGWSFPDFVAHLNEHVFFWPGTLSGPISYGIRHFNRYANEDIQIIVLDTAAVIDANKQLAIRFCRYNSGSPRCSGGRRSPRGPDTFLTATEFDGTPSSVVEVVFRGTVIVPVKGVAVCSPDVILNSGKPGTRRI